MAPNNSHSWVLWFVWISSHWLLKSAQDTRKIRQKACPRLTVGRLQLSWSLSLSHLLWGNLCHEQSYDKVPGKKWSFLSKVTFVSFGKDVTASETSAQIAWPWPQEKLLVSLATPAFSVLRHRDIISVWHCESGVEDNSLCNNRWWMWTTNS